LMLFSRSLARHTSTNVPLNLNPALHLTARTSTVRGRKVRLSAATGAWSISARPWHGLPCSFP
jgi:hypothetical protein